MRQKPAAFKRLFISGLQGGTGKTILSIGIIAAWKKCGRSIAPYKKGPDYIDAGWLGLAAGRPCYNLDTFLVKKEDVLHSFLSHTLPEDIAVIEGNRGLYDGIDIQGTTSSAETAKLLSSPLILCIDCTKSTRTMAAVVLGCMRFDPDLKIKGIVLNRIAGVRHEKNLRNNIEHYCGVPVVGAVPRMNSHDFPERHMGLVPTPEHILAKKSINAAADMAEKYLDMKTIEDIAESAAEYPLYINERHTHSVRNMLSPGESKPRIGIIRDSAFQFYYPDNIEALVSAGAELVFISAQKDEIFPSVDGLYIGGGFPETHVRELSNNNVFIRELKRLANEGLPVYAECGGLMYLGESLIIEGRTWPMTGILPAVFGISKKPQGLGYTIINVDRENPWFETGMEVRGHEFRYSKVLEWRGSDDYMAFAMKRGTGFINKRDGIFYKNVFATYTHIHALGLPSWAETMVSKASAYKKFRKSA